MAWRSDFATELEYRKLWAGYFPENISAERIANYFESYGPVDRVDMLKSSKDPKKYFAFVVFEDRAIVEDLSNLIAVRFGDHQIQVRRSKIRSNKIFVGRVWNSPDFFRYFSRFGKILDVDFPHDAQNKPKGYAFVEYQSYNSVLSALYHKDHYFKGRKIVVKKAIKKGEVNPHDIPDSQLTMKDLLYRTYDDGRPVVIGRFVSRLVGQGNKTLRVVPKNVYFNEQKTDKDLKRSMPAQELSDEEEFMKMIKIGKDGCAELDIINREEIKEILKIALEEKAQRESKKKASQNAPKILEVNAKPETCPKQQDASIPKEVEKKSKIDKPETCPKQQDASIPKKVGKKSKIDKPKTCPKQQDASTPKKVGKKSKIDKPETCPKQQDASTPKKVEKKSKIDKWEEVDLDITFSDFDDDYMDIPKRIRLDLA